MDFSAGQYYQLIIALILVMGAFVFAYSGPERLIVSALFLLIPFQLLVSRYGSLNTGLALLVFVAFVLNRRITQWPMMSWTGIVLFAYLLSMTGIVKSTYKDHFLYLVAVAANISVFWIAYNYVKRHAGATVFFNLLVSLNVLVALYCYVQLLLGFDNAALFGVSELSIQSNRQDARLAGPFAAVGITAEYLVIQVFVLLYLVLNKCTVRQRYLYIGLIAANFAFLIATGNRGGIVILLLGALLFFLFFRRDFGGSRLFVRGAIGSVLFGVVALLVISFTQFNVLFDRLADTEVREGLPDTRAVIWPLAWERIQDAPVLGHGPRIRLIDEQLRRIPGHEFMPYPHSTYLFLLYTLGAVGLLAYIAFFTVYFRRIYRMRRNSSDDPLLRGVPKLTLLILILIFVDQAKVSMFRFNLSDYQQFVFALLGGLLALSELASMSPGAPPVQSAPLPVSAGMRDRVIRKRDAA